MAWVDRKIEFATKLKPIVGEYLSCIEEYHPENVVFQVILQPNSEGTQLTLVAVHSLNGVNVAVASGYTIFDDHLVLIYLLKNNRLTSIPDPVRNEPLKNFVRDYFVKKGTLREFDKDQINWCPPCWTIKNISADSLILQKDARCPFTPQLDSVKFLPPD